MTGAQQALSGLRIVDLSSGVSGPYCTRLLADLGAEVIKIEKPGEGDEARKWGPFPEDQPHPEKSGLFLYLNAGKKGITLNLDTETGAEIFRAMVKEADVVVENFPPGILSRLNLGYETLTETNPALIMTSISYFGQAGTYRDYQGSDMIAQALGGLMQLSGLPDREPLKAPGCQAEYLAGINAAAATLTAVYHRDETGLGQWVDVSAVEAVASLLEGAVLGYSYNRVLRQRSGSRHPALYPSAILPARDDYLYVDAGGDLESLASFLGLPQFEPKFRENPRQYADELDALILPRLQERTAAELFEQAQEWRLPFARVLGIEDVLHDPQHQARGFFVEIDHPVAGSFRYPGAPFQMSQTPCRVSRPAPRLGEHNQEIYCRRLGFSAAELVKLREAGVI